MRKNIVQLLGLVMLGNMTSLPVQAYELSTHARITREAFDRSVLNDRPVLEGLGIYTVVKDQSGEFIREPFGSDYYDIYGNSAIARSADLNKHPFALKYMGLPNPKDGTTLPAWLMRGAIREDDYYKGENPQDDPYGQAPGQPNYGLRRPFHHFFDPINNQPLTVFGLGLLDSDVHTAPAWALGTTNAEVFTQPNNPEVARRNHFTVFDAREAMYRALTGKKLDGTNADPAASDTNPAPESVRKAYWATTFRALGDILHLNQDMAQPQHTRNDPHAGKSPTILTGHASIYEEYIEARATGNTAYKIGDGLPIPPEPLSYTGYAIPRLAKYSEYWSTQKGPTGAGLADYSNSSFFSFGTNLGNNSYPSPSNNPADYISTDVTGLFPAEPNQKINFLSLNGDPKGLWLTTQSVFDYFLFNTTYSLNRYNYDDMAGELIPRAVAYSAGLIDYFFRGRMEITMPDDGVYALANHGVESQKDVSGFRTLKLKLKNTTPTTTGLPGVEPMQGGALVAVVKFHRNNCYTPDLSGEYGGAPPDPWGTCRAAEEEIVVSDVQALSSDIDQGPQQFTFTFQNPIPINATDLFLQVVYRGPLGQESDAVVVATKDISEPTFDGVANGLEQHLYTHPSGESYCPPYSSECFTELSWKQLYCEIGHDPYIEYETCRAQHPYSFYMRFVSPGNYDPANAVATFNAQVTMVLPVSSYGRFALLTDNGPYTRYSIYADTSGAVLYGGVISQSAGDAAINQYDSTIDDLILTPYYPARGILAGYSWALELLTGTASQLGTNDVRYPPDLGPLMPMETTINFQ